MQGTLSVQVVTLDLLPKHSALVVHSRLLTVCSGHQAFLLNF